MPLPLFAVQCGTDHFLVQASSMPELEAAIRQMFGSLLNPANRLRVVETTSQLQCEVDDGWFGDEVNGSSNSSLTPDNVPRSINLRVDQVPASTPKRSYSEFAGKDSAAPKAADHIAVMKGKAVRTSTTDAQPAAAAAAASQSNNQAAAATSKDLPAAPPDPQHETPAPPQNRKAVSSQRTQRAADKPPSSGTATPPPQAEVQQRATKSSIFSSSPAAREAAGEAELDPAGYGSVKAARKSAPPQRQAPAASAAESIPAAQASGDSTSVPPPAGISVLVSPIRRHSTGNNKSVHFEDDRSAAADASVATAPATEEPQPVRSRKAARPASASRQRPTSGAPSAAAQPQDDTDDVPIDAVPRHHIKRPDLHPSVVAKDPTPGYLHSPAMPPPGSPSFHDSHRNNDVTPPAALQQANYSAQDDTSRVSYPGTEGAHSMMPNVPGDFSATQTSYTHPVNNTLVADVAAPQPQSSFVTTTPRAPATDYTRLDELLDSDDEEAEKVLLKSEARRKAAKTGSPPRARKAVPTASGSAGVAPSGKDITISLGELRGISTVPNTAPAVVDVRLWAIERCTASPGPGEMFELYEAATMDICDEDEEIAAVINANAQLPPATAVLIGKWDAPQSRPVSAATESVKVQRTADRIKATHAVPVEPVPETGRLTPQPGSSPLPPGVVVDSDNESPEVVRRPQPGAAQRKASPPRRQAGAGEAYPTADPDYPIEVVENRQRSPIRSTTPNGINESLKNMFPAYGNEAPPQRKAANLPPASAGPAATYPVPAWEDPYQRYVSQPPAVTVDELTAGPTKSPPRHRYSPPNAMSAANFAGATNPSPAAAVGSPPRGVATVAGIPRRAPVSTLRVFRVATQNVVPITFNSAFPPSVWLLRQQIRAALGIADNSFSMAFTAPSAPDARPLLGDGDVFSAAQFAHEENACITVNEY